jgi:small-conductance mechanosensitive channel
MSNSISLPLFSAIEFLLFVLLLYIFLRVAVKIISYINVFRKPYIFIKKFLPVVDLTVLVIITFWILYRIFKDSDLLPIIMAAVALIFVSLFGWLWGRDFIAGIILKSENYFEKNKKIRLNNKSGKIVKTTMRYLEFETDEGEAVRVPYSRITGEYFTKLSPGEKYESHLIVLEVNEAVDTKSLRETVRKNIFNSPWYLVRKEPVIEILSADAGGYKINLNIYSLNSSHADLIRQDLLAGFRV